MDGNSSTGMEFYQGYVAANAAAALGTQTGNQTVAIGSTPGFTEFYWALDPEHTPPTPPVDNAPMLGGKLDALLDASITIKDVSSGLDHKVSLVRDLSHGTQDPWLGTPVMLVGDGEDIGETFDLGTNRYQVKFKQAIGPDGPNLTGKTQLLVAEVTVTSTVDTPEPGTIALGGIGLAGVFGMRLRRKRIISG